MKLKAKFKKKMKTKQTSSDKTKQNKATPLNQGALQQIGDRKPRNLKTAYMTI